MFFCILVHGKGYRQVNKVFNHSFETICHYVKEVLRAVIVLSTRLIRPSHNYNDSLWSHRLDLNKHPLFQDCIDAINEMHVKVVLPWNELVHFIGRKGAPTPKCAGHMRFQFMFHVCVSRAHQEYARCSTTCVCHPLARHLFLLPGLGKYYLVDLRFAHRLGYMAPYKGVDEAFTRADEDEDAADVELSNADHKMHAKMHALKLQRNEWDKFRDYMAQQL
ncbi:uncharacterized protein LOC111383799 [Olea europaea var. sylvestris]|uniref:uncharacterized protein LOC111383799 n=1 Tax=Olea europaea var. sylvestris TaxID=158386 RepID=UPI000C1D8AEA|nr:uncharacterized protein LOC111383799 [Olea europaea var. sylvestris]